MNTENLPRLFRSRRFWSWLIGTLVALLVVLVPSLEGQEDTLLAIIEKMTITLISAYGLQDVVTAWRNGSPSNTITIEAASAIMQDEPALPGK